MQARKFRVRGRVQGVGFRYFVWREAEALGAAGWVRNMADGSVEVLAAASDETLDQLLRRLQEGPRSSRVKSVAVAQVPVEEVPGGFEIRRDGY